MVDELGLASPGRVIEAEFAIDEPMNCDRIRIGQLLSNLLGNAVTHRATDKPVVVHAETRYCDYPSRTCPKAFSGRTRSLTIFRMAGIGTANIAPGTPHIQNQNRLIDARARARRVL